jgi:hypothetical protein
MKRIRQLHLYLGTFFAPAILFFALTGALQTFGLHESPKGSSVKRPAWIAKLAEVHKDQRLPQPRPAAEGAERPRNARPAEAGGKARQEGGTKPARSPLPLKIFVLFMSVGLISTTLLGIYMAFKYNRDRRVVWGLLIAGTLLPIALLYL